MWEYDNGVTDTANIADYLTRQSQAGWEVFTILPHYSVCIGNSAQYGHGEYELRTVLVVFRRAKVETVKVPVVVKATGERRELAVNISTMPEWDIKGY